MKKITKTTFKTFLKKNTGQLYIRVKSSFDGMVDGCTNESDRGFNPAIPTDDFADHKYGYKGVWLVGGGRDYFRHYEDNDFIGLEVSNCCGNFYIVIRKLQLAA